MQINIEAILLVSVKINGDVPVLNQNVDNTGAVHAVASFPSAPYVSQSNRVGNYSSNY